MQIDFLNPRSIILFIGILQGAVFAGLLVFRYARQRAQADIWLAALLILMCLSLVTHFIGFAHVYNVYQGLTYFPFGQPFAYGVCIYFYVLSLTNDSRRFTRRDLFWFTPAIIYLVYHLTLWAQSIEFKNWYDGAVHVPYIDPIFDLGAFVLNAYFLWLSIKHYSKYRLWLDQNYSDTEKIKFDWLRNFLYIFAAVIICAGAFDFVNFAIGKLTYIQYYYFNVIRAVATYYVAITGYMRSQVIEIKFAETAEDEGERKAPVSENELQNLITRLNEMMHEEKPYLNPELTLADLSRSLGVNSSVLSHVINTGFGKNFNDFINEHRIDEVKQKLKKDSGSTMLGIALECGFNSKATFNRAFKKFTGVSPREFQTANPEI